MEVNLKCVETFADIYKVYPDGVAFCPYRVCPIGAHVDHNFGKITGFAIDKGIHIAYKPKKNGVIELISLQFTKRAQFHINSVPEEMQLDWADYLRGAVIELSQKYYLHTGLCGVIEGTLPIGGLSSSAAVIIAFLSALCKVNNITLSKEEIINIALKAENNYVGVACGKLDQSCEVYSQKGRMLYLDTLDDTYELITPPSHIKQYKFAIFFSGVERNLAGTKFNVRVDECKSAAYALMAYAGMDYGSVSETVLRDVPFEVFQSYKDKLPVPFAARAEHWYTENMRVEQGVQAFSNGDIEEYGRLSFQSGKSSIVNWQTGSPELKALFDIMLQTDGIYGGRFSGAGFKGCCMGIIDPAYEESIIETVTKKYTEEFPLLKDKFSIHICNSADGVKI